jgi:hypothetical protein
MNCSSLVAVLLTSNDNQPMEWRYREWIGLYANLALAIVGIGGIVVAIFTLYSIKRQAIEMRLQRIVMRRTLNAIRRQADLMDKQSGHMESQISEAKAQVTLMASQNKAIRDRERARLTLVFPPHKPDFSSPSRMTIDDEPELMMELSVALHNDGPSKAFGVRMNADMRTLPQEDPFLEGIKMAVSIPDVIREVDINSPMFVLVRSLLTGQEVDDVMAGKADFYLYGEITYSDVFNVRHRTPFRFLWEVTEWHDRDGSKQLSGGWVNQSPAST